MSERTQRTKERVKILADTDAAIAQAEDSTEAPVGTSENPSSQVFTVANVITFCRLALTIAFLALFAGGIHRTAALVCYVIAGLANLGLPGLSGFVAEMTIFTGSFQHADAFHRVWTIIATASIVITAVYILRLVGKILYGTCTNEHHLKLTDATWDERLSVICLIVAVAGLGLAPLWVSNMVSGGVAPIIEHIGHGVSSCNPFI